MLAVPRASGEPAANDAAPSTPAGHRPGVSAGLWTLPNALSLVRLLGVPLFVYLLLGPHADGWALVVLMVSGVTDYLDGKLARLLDQTSTVGALLDPAADRLYILSILVTFGLRGIIPWWLAGLILGRDLVLLATVPLLRSRGLNVLPVHYLGKAATFCLLYAFPLLLATGFPSAATVAAPIAYSLTAWGTVLYLWAGVLYLVQARSVLRELPRRGSR